MWNNKNERLRGNSAIPKEVKRRIEKRILVTKCLIYEFYDRLWEAGMEPTSPLLKRLLDSYFSLSSRESLNYPLIDATIKATLPSEDSPSDYHGDPASFPNSYLNSNPAIYLQQLSASEKKFPPSGARGERRGHDLIRCLENYRIRYASTLSPTYIRAYHSISKVIERFVAIKGKLEKRRFRLYIEDFDLKILEEFNDFMQSEVRYAKRFPSIYRDVPERCICHRSPNTMMGYHKKLHQFIKWCIKQRLLATDPYLSFKMPTTKYSEPFFLSNEERNILRDFDLSAQKELEETRDIFIFQCLTGCRWGDLMRLTTQNIEDETLQYIAHKTAWDNEAPVKIPLTATALRIAKRYAEGRDDGRIFPRISLAGYNNKIKRILYLCGITRGVAILDPSTGEHEVVPIYKKASSHMARRSFIGNMYNHLKDPEIIGSMSGHREGSRSFKRYRRIDMEIKREAVAYLEDD